MKTRCEILVVDDEEIMAQSLAGWLREDGYTVETASSGSAAVAMAGAKPYTLYFVDLKMPGGIDGLETMRAIRRLQPDSVIVIITAYATVETAVAAIKEGAYDYVVKPYNPGEISLIVRRVVEIKDLQRENALLRKRLSGTYNFHDIISKSEKMHAIFELVCDVANIRSTVLIQGESGTGKELVARAIHYSSDRGSRPFIAVSCAALAETLLESELFGHEKGSFTGATAQHRGKFEMAQGGTIFLDEIGDISPKLQLDLLRVLERRRFYRVGGSEEIKVDVRTIAATNADLREAVYLGKFRDDLYYRLNVINISLPPLRERREDIPLLAEHFVERLCRETGRKVDEISPDALSVLMDYGWPGNVRELENAIERAVVTCRTAVLGRHDFEFLNQPPAGAGGTWEPPSGTSLQEVEKVVIAAALKRHGGNITETSAVLGIDRSTLYEKIRKYQISRDK